MIADEFPEMGAISPQALGGIIDPFGHRWGLPQKIEDVAPDEVVRRAAALFDTGGGG